MKLVIYKNLKGYCITNERNYNANISNAREIQDCSAFNSATEIIDYYCKYFKCNTNDFIVINN